MKRKILFFIKYYECPPFINNGYMAHNWTKIHLKFELLGLFGIIFFALFFNINNKNIFRWIVLKYHVSKNKRNMLLIFLFQKIEFLI